MVVTAKIVKNIKSNTKGLGVAPLTDRNGLCQLDDEIFISLAKIHASSFEKQWPAIGFKNMFRPPDGRKTHYREMLMVKKNLLIGFVIFLKMVDEAEIISMAIAPNCRGKGFGHILLTKSIELIKAEAIKKVFLEVNIQNIAAIKTYEQANFEQISIRKGYYKSKAGVKADALIYAKSL